MPSPVEIPLRFALLVTAWVLASLTTQRPLAAQPTPLGTERPISFDSRGRVMTLTSKLVERLALGAASVPLPLEAGTELRLFSVNDLAGDTTRAAAGPVATIVKTYADGLVARFGVEREGLRAIRAAFDNALQSNLSGFSAQRGSASGTERSEPAGNTFVRNQTFLGLAAYGPATAAILSKNGTAAGGGYLLAAGGSFFVAAEVLRTRPVTRAQTILGTHAGFRGGAAGAAVAAIADASGGPRYGIPILAGAITGTVAGYLAGGNMTDGEAAASGLGADMLALSTLGIATAVNAFKDSENTRRKVTLGAAVAAGVLGYDIGPLYARHSSYNVTAGDVNVAFSAALLGAAAGSAITDPGHNTASAAAFASAGLLAGFAVGDRLLVRRADRTSADGTWVRLGAIAGALMGGGVAVIAKAEPQVTLALVAGGGALGLVAADRAIGPAADAGPAHGFMRSSSLAPGSTDEPRVRVALGSAVATLALWSRRPGNLRGQGRGNAVMNARVIGVRF